jgi:hypothetical protein
VRVTGTILTVKQSFQVGHCFVCALKGLGIIVGHHELQAISHRTNQSRVCFPQEWQRPLSVCRKRLSSGLPAPSCYQRPLTVVDSVISFKQLMLFNWSVPKIFRPHIHAQQSRQLDSIPFLLQSAPALELLL